MAGFPNFTRGNSSPHAGRRATVVQPETVGQAFGLPHPQRHPSSFLLPTSYLPPTSNPVIIPP